MKFTEGYVHVAILIQFININYVCKNKLYRCKLIHLKKKNCH